MNRIDETFAQLRKGGRKALIAYLAAGYPGLSLEEKIIKAIAKGGVDILELGVPFSDPIADGPTIQFASHKALEAGMTLRKIFRFLLRLRKTLEIPIALMSYVNPILKYGTRRFLEEAKRCGVDGLILPDMIPEEEGSLRREARTRGIHLIHFVSPTTPPARRRAIARTSQGFIYALSVTGVTGARRTFPAETMRMLKGLRRLTPKPIALGFGVSRADQVRALRPYADGFIVGSALIDALRRHPGSSRAPAAAARFLRPLRRALDASPGGSPRGC